MGEDRGQDLPQMAREAHEAIEHGIAHDDPESLRRGINALRTMRPAYRREVLARIDDEFTLRRIAEGAFEPDTTPPDS